MREASRCSRKKILITGDMQTSIDFRRYADEHADIKEAYGYDRELLFFHLVHYGVSEGRSWHSTDPAVEEIIMGYDAAAKEALIRALVGDAREESAKEESLILPEVTGAEALRDAEIDFIRYAKEYPEAAKACDGDEAALAAYYWEKGMREGHQVHSENAEKEKILSGNDAAAKAELLQRYRNPYALGGMPSEWQRGDFSEEEEEKIRAFYGKTLLTGDSIMQGYQRVCAAAGDPFLLSFQFLASHGYTLELALKDGGDGYHPVYRGERMPLWECVPPMECDTLICFLGEGDLSVGAGAKACADMYERLLDRILEKQPDIKVILISLTYVYDGVNRSTMHSANIAAANEAICQMAQRKGWGFVDVSYAMSDGYGNLTPEYSLDQQTHYIPDAYAVWTRVLKSYALREEKP